VHDSEKVGEKASRVYNVPFLKNYAEIKPQVIKTAGTAGTVLAKSPNGTIVPRTGTLVPVRSIPGCANTDQSHVLLVGPPEAARRLGIMIFAGAVLPFTWWIKSSTWGYNRTAPGLGTRILLTPTARAWEHITLGGRCWRPRASVLLPSYASFILSSGRSWSMVRRSEARLPT
jgi:hypothetical protein